MHHGRIDEIGDLAGFDLLEFNGGVNPWGGGEFAETGFHRGAESYRKAVQKWGFANLGRVADVGSGFGRWSLFLGEVNDDVHGYERNEGGVALAEKLATHFGFANVHSHVADVSRKIPAENGWFDGVWCYGTLHIVNRETALAEMHRILKPGGILFLGKMNSAGQVLARFFKGYSAGGMSNHRIRSAINAMQQGPLFNGKGNYTTRETIEQTLEQFGFKLAAEYPIEVEQSKIVQLDEDMTNALRDLPALGRRLENDPAFAAEFAQHLEVADFYPRALNLCAIKV